MPPSPPQGEEAGDGDAHGQGDVHQPEDVEDSGDRGERRCPARDHLPQPRIVPALDTGQRPVVADRHEDADGERDGDGGDGDVTAGCSHECVLFWPWPRRRAQPEHAAPRPHRARPSVSRTWLTSLDRGTNDTAVSAAPARTDDTPGGNWNR